MFITAKTLNRLAASQTELGKKVEKEHAKTIEKALDATEKGNRPSVKKVEDSIIKDHTKENKNYYQPSAGVTKDVLLVPASLIIRKATIVKREDGYHVISEKKTKGKHKHLGGPYKSRAKAVKRLQQIEAFKHMKGGAIAEIDKLFKKSVNL